MVSSYVLLICSLWQTNRALHFAIAALYTMSSVSLLFVFLLALSLDCEMIIFDGNVKIVWVYAG